VASRRPSGPGGIVKDDRSVAGRTIVRHRGSAPARGARPDCVARPAGAPSVRARAARSPSG